MYIHICGPSSRVLALLNRGFFFVTSRIPCATWCACVYVYTYMWYLISCTALLNRGALIFFLGILWHITLDMRDMMWVCVCMHIVSHFLFYSFKSRRINHFLCILVAYHASHVRHDSFTCDMTQKSIHVWHTMRQMWRFRMSVCMFIYVYIWSPISCTAVLRGGGWILFVLWVCTCDMTYWSIYVCRMMYSSVTLSCVCVYVYI